MKKIISFAVILVMLLTMSVPMALAAGAPENVGSVDDQETYTPTCPDGGTLIAVDNKNEFVNMTGGKDNYYYLTTDLTFTKEELVGKNAVWSKAKILNFDGCGHTISGIEINVTSGDVGVFNQVDCGTIKNLNVEATLITTASGKSGGLIMASKRTTTDGVRYDVLELENIKVDINLKASKAGGLVGYSENGTINVKNCAVYGDIDTTSWTAGYGHNTGTGGFLGQTKKAGTIENSTNNAHVKGGAHVTGGIIGRVTYGYVIKNCVNNGLVETTVFNDEAPAGGFVGMAETVSGKIKTEITDSINNGNVIGTRDAGGFVGGARNADKSPIYIDGCINNGTVIGGETAKGNKLGGIVGEVTNSATVKNCVNNGSVMGAVATAESTDSGIGAIIGGAFSTDVSGTLNLTGNTNNGAISNVGGDSYVSALAGNVATATVTSTDSVNTGMISKLIDGKKTTEIPTGANKPKAFVQMTEGEIQSLRFILAMSEAEYTEAAESLSFKISFKMTDGKVYSKSFSEIVAFKSVETEKEDFFAADGVVFCGVIVTDVISAEWTKCGISYGGDTWAYTK